MGRVKELLLIKEEKEMEKLPNKNLREFLLTMSSEFIPEAYEQDNHYLIKYNLLDLRSLKPVTISEKVLISDLEHNIPKQLAKIINETYFNINGCESLTYKALINNGWLDTEYLLEAIPLKKSISSLNDLLIIPSSEKIIKHYLYQINNSLEDIGSELYEMRGENTDNLNKIDKALDLIGYVLQN